MIFRPENIFKTLYLEVIDLKIGFFVGGCQEISVLFWVELSTVGISALEKYKGSIGYFTGKVFHWQVLPPQKNLG